MNPTLGALALTLSTGFTQYSTPVQNIQCKELDFSSYHKVENVKTNMIRSNPERSHPNFAGKYLLLKNDFLFDTVWFVADCSTGKFIKESLSTDHKDPHGEFHPNSNLLAVSSVDPKNTTPLEFHVFTNEKWMKVEVAPSPSPTPSPLTTISTVPISAVAVSSNTNCKPLDFNSNSRAQTAKKNLLSNTPDLTHPNFSGHYLLLKADTIFQSYWLIADCNTGKFSSDLLNGNIEFNKDSPTVKIISSGNFPTFSMWLEEDQQWFMLQGSNTLNGKSAQLLFDSIPNPEKSNIVRFEKLKWKINGTDLKIETGRCVHEMKKYSCTIDLSPEHS